MLKIDVSHILARQGNCSRISAIRPKFGNAWIKLMTIKAAVAMRQRTTKKSNLADASFRRKKSTLVDEAFLKERGSSAMLGIRDTSLFG
jgi:hypothetical protein